MVIGGDYGISIVLYGMYVKDIEDFVEVFGMLVGEVFVCVMCNGGEVMDLMGKFGMFKDNIFVDMLIVDGDLFVDVCVLQDYFKLEVIKDGKRVVDQLGNLIFGFQMFFDW